MNDSVRALGQHLITALQHLAHAQTDANTRFCEAFTILAETQDRLEGLRLSLLDEAFRAGATQAVDQVRNSTRTTDPRAQADLRLSLDLGDRFTTTGQALSDGTISAAQAEAMISGLRKLPVTLNRGELDTCQQELLAHTHELGPTELRALAARMFELIDPEAAERSEQQRLAREERQAKAGRSLRLTPDHHGSVKINGQLPVAEAALVQAELDALMPPASTYLSSGEAPSPDARRADALVLLAQLAANSGNLPDHGTDRPRAYINIPLSALATGTGTVELIGPDGARISAGEARRMACDADLIPAVLGGESEILDLGREQRLVSNRLRAALTLRDQGCAFPSCTTRPACCEAHHVQPWWAGGTTDLGNLVLLCPHHHRLVEPDPNQSEQSQWQVHLDPETGRAWFTPPRHIDPARRPRQHRRFHLADIRLEPIEPNPATPALPDPWHPADQPWPAEPATNPWHPVP